MDEIKIFASRISNLVVRNETVLNWSSLLESYGFKEVYDNNPKIDAHQSNNNPEYEGEINKIFLECIKRNKLDAELMLNDLLNKFGITENQMEELFRPKFKFIENDNITDISKTAFISYSSKDDVDFDKITKALNEIGFDSFIAKEDIKLSEFWEKRILRQLDESNIFIAILSDNFKDSNYCNHELGIAIHRKMLIIPLSLDDNPSYGLFEKFESKPIEKYRELQQTIVDYYSKQTIDYFLINLNNVQGNWNYDSCNLHLKLMEPYFKEFSNIQVEKLVNAVLTNNQLHGRYGKPYLNSFYEMHKDKIPKNNLKEFERIIM